MALGFCWMVFCIIQFYRRYRQLVIDRDIPAHVRCETCGNVYDVSAAEAMKPGFSKSRSVTKTETKGIALVNQPRYGHFAKKLSCPHCKKRCWGEITNVNDLTGATAKDMLRAGLPWIAAMAIGCLLMLGL